MIGFDGRSSTRPWCSVATNDQRCVVIIESTGQDITTTENVALMRRQSFDVVIITMRSTASNADPLDLMLEQFTRQTYMGQRHPYKGAYVELLPRPSIRRERVVIAAAARGHRPSDGWRLAARQHQVAACP